MPLRTVDVSENDLFKKTFTPAVLRLIQIFEDNNYALRIVGGAVRDILLGVEPQDLDFATDATIEQMKEILHKEGITTIRENGEKHGTVTARLDHVNYEITVLQAKWVFDPSKPHEFVTDWEADAWRRDLTVNAFFLDHHGMVYDYVQGLEDLAVRRIVFAGDATQKILEDHRHILRYFRFFGRLAGETTKLEEELLEKFRQHREGLEKVNVDRAWAQLRLIVVGPRADEVLETMLDCGLGPPLGLPAQVDIARFRRVFREHQGHLEPTTLIATLLEKEEDVRPFAKRFAVRKLKEKSLQISTNEGRQLRVLISRREEAMQNADNEAFWWHLRIEAEQNPRFCSSIYAPSIEQLARSTLSKSQFESYWARPVPTFPLKTKDLLDAKVKKIRFKETVEELFQLWKQSECTKTKEVLLKQLDFM